MNISTLKYRADNEPGYEHLAGERTLDRDLAEHRFILSRSGETLTGHVALISEPDQGDLPGSLQVWSMTVEDDWIHVTPDGIVLRSPNPLGE